MKRRVIIAVCIGVLMCPAWPVTAAKPSAEAARTAGDIEGVVETCGPDDPSGIEVHIPGRSFTARLGSDGVFVLNYVPAGIYELQFVLNGEILQSLPGVAVVSKQTTELGSVFLLCVDSDGDGFDETVDCNDQSPLIYPGAAEQCNGLDDDCDTVIDNGLPLQLFYRDVDSDGYGDPSAPFESCAAPLGYVSNDQDCYDQNDLAHPGQASYVDTQRGDGSFDYNCDGIESQEWPSEAECDELCTEIGSGFKAPVPSCGQMGSFLFFCEWDDLLLHCTEQTGPQTQRCR